MSEVILLLEVELFGKSLTTAQTDDLFSFTPLKNDFLEILSDFAD